MLGISIYPEKEKIEDILNYLTMSAKYGFKRVFTCLLSANNSKEEIKKEFKTIIEHATSLNMEVVLDVAPSIFSKLEISYDDLLFFKELGATGIRLDEGFDGFKEAQMTFNKYNLDIEINMSTGTKYIDMILSYNPNKKKLIACHNFYPMEYSGLSLEHFIKTSLQFKELGIRTAAFVSSPSADHGPWGVMDGLCTLEMHRKLPITTQVKHLLLMDLVDDIIIANALASEQELIAISSLTQCPEFDIIFNKDVSDLERKIILDEPHINRGDCSEYLARSTQSRIKYANENLEPKNVNKHISKGDVCIGNNNFDKYKCELQLILKDHSDDKKRKNIAAKIVDHELFLIDYLKPWSAFSFKEIK